MGIRESLLNTITSVGNSDFVRIVTSAGASSKATVQNLFKSFETGLSEKSSLTTSDYIRVVGSDNNLYKQSVSSVKSDMGVSALETSLSNLNNVTGVTDLNDAIGNNRVYYFNSNATNKPSGLNYGYIFVMTEANGINCQQIVVGRGGTDAGAIYRRGRNNTGTWGAWVKEPTRAEIDALNSKTTPTSHTMTFGDKNWVFSKVGRLIIVSAYTDIKSASAGLNAIGTLPAEYRPIFHIYMGVQNAQNDNQRRCFMNIPANGEVTFYTPVAISAAQNCGIGGVYISAT